MVLTSRKNAWQKIFIFPLRYYAKCVSTTVTGLILRNVESVYFFYSMYIYIYIYIYIYNIYSAVPFYENLKNAYLKKKSVIQKYYTGLTLSAKFGIRLTHANKWGDSASLISRVLYLSFLQCCRRTVLPIVRHCFIVINNTVVKLNIYRRSADCFI